LFSVQDFNCQSYHLMEKHFTYHNSAMKIFTILLVLSVLIVLTTSASSNCPTRTSVNDCDQELDCMWCMEKCIVKNSTKPISSLCPCGTDEVYRHKEFCTPNLYNGTCYWCAAKNRCSNGFVARNSVRNHKTGFVVLIIVGVIVPCCCFCCLGSCICAGIEQRMPPEASDYIVRHTIQRVGDNYYTSSTTGKEEKIRGAVSLGACCGCSFAAPVAAAVLGFWFLGSFLKWKVNVCK
jgi:hypothetical protein